MTIIFMRGVNVGGHKRFSPAKLAKDLAKLEVINIGAAGTFVVRKPISQKQLCDELRRRVPFEVDLMMCRADDVLKLAAGTDRDPPEVRRSITVLLKAPGKIPPLPISYPLQGNWQVQIVQVQGNMVCTLWRKPRTGSFVYPNEVVEKIFDGASTTRAWNTLLRICRIIRS